MGKKYVIYTFAQKFRVVRNSGAIWGIAAVPNCWLYACLPTASLLRFAGIRACAAVCVVVGAA